MSKTHTFTIEQIAGQDVAVLRTVDGYMFTVGDWQSTQPKDITEVNKFDWFCVDPDMPKDTTRWRRAIMLDGLPVVLGKEARV